MSKIQIEVGSATVEVMSSADTAGPTGTFPHYQERDLLDAACAALLAINNPRSVAWADAIFQLTADGR